MELQDVVVVGDAKVNGNCVQDPSRAPLLPPTCGRQMSIQSSVSSSGSFLRAERGHHRNRRRERLNTELLQAASAGDSDKVIRLINEGGSPNATCRQSHQSALHLAAANGFSSLVDVLINKGGNAEARDALGRQPVHLAAWNGHMNTLATFSQVNKELLSSDIKKQNTELNDGDLDSWTHKHIELLGYLDVFTEGSTPLHLVCKKSNVTCVNFLLHMGVPVDVQDARGLTPLDVIGAEDDDLDVMPGLAASSDSFVPGDQNKLQGSMPSFESISFKMPPKLSKLNVRSKTTVYPPVIEGVNSASPPSPSDVFQGSFKKSCVTSIAKSLLERGAKMPKSQLKLGYARDQSRKQLTVLHTAVEDNNVDLVKLLLEQNGCMMSWNEKGETPLHMAVKNLYIEPLKAMLAFKDRSRGPVIDVRDSQGRTLLHLAVMMNWMDGVSLLLEHGADIKTSNNVNENVLHLAAESGNAEMLEDLLSVVDSAKVLDDKDRDHLTPLCKAVNKGYLDCVKLLVESGADSNILLPGDRTIVHLCAENNFSHLLDYFLKQTSAREMKDIRCRPERGGMTPLQLAASLGFNESVDVLLRSNCNVRLESTEYPHSNSTAVHLAARNGYDEVIRKILACDSCVLTSKDSRGWYPLHVAASNGHSKCASIMIEYGADLAESIVDEKGIHLTGLEVIIYCIPQPIEFLVEVLDSYIKVNNFPISDPKCELKVKFDVLIPKTSCKQLRVLTAILNCKRENLQERLLLHPIVQTFLHLKWMKLRLFFYIIMLLYFIFTLSLTSLAVWFYILKNDSSTIVRFITGILFASLIPIILAESVNVGQLQRYYIQDYESWVKWTVFGCSLIVALVDPSLWWSRHLAAITVLLAWFELLLLVARCPNWGFYVLMFSRVAIKVFKVLVTFTFLLTGFTFAFMIQFDGQGPFSTVWQSLVKVFVMMLEFDYEDTFENIQDSDWLSFVGRGTFLFFVVLVAIVLMNLMVGLAVSDITVLEKQGRTQRLAKQVGFLSLLEVLVGSNSSLSVMPPKLRIWAENRRSVMPEIIIKAGGTTMDCGDTCLPRHIKESITEIVINSRHSKDLPNMSMKDIVLRLDQIEYQDKTFTLNEVTQIRELVNSQNDAIQLIHSQLNQLMLMTNQHKSQVSASVETIPTRTEAVLNLPNVPHVI